MKYIVFKNMEYYPYVVIETDSLAEAKDKFKEWKDTLGWCDEELFLCKVVEKFVNGEKEVR